MEAEIMSEVNLNGDFYSYLQEKNKYDENLQKVINNTVIKLIKEQTTANKPGMLLGKIQSGKTRAFIGIMGLAFDNNYEVVVILTKNSNALARQTIP